MRKSCPICETANDPTNLRCWSCDSDLGGASESVEDQIAAVCDFVKAYELRKYEVMIEGGPLLGVVFFMQEYCESLRIKLNDQRQERS